MRVREVSFLQSTPNAPNTAAPSANPAANPTALVLRAAGGDADAMRALFTSLYPDLKRLARVRLAQVGGVTGLNATALVHEGFMRMAEREGLRGQTRLQFFAYIGKVLRSVVIDFVRERDAAKRGGGVTLLTMSHADAEPAPWMEATDLIDLDRGLEQLRRFDERLYQVVEMHVFSGMSCAEVGKEIGVTERTVNRDLAKAHALLAQVMGGAPAPAPVDATAATPSTKI